MPPELMTSGAHPVPLMGPGASSRSLPLVPSGGCGHRGNVRRGSEHFLFQAQFQHIAGGRVGAASPRDQPLGGAHAGRHALPPRPPPPAERCHSCSFTAPGVTWKILSKGLRDHQPPTPQASFGQEIGPEGTAGAVCESVCAPMATRVCIWVQGSHISDVCTQMDTFVPPVAPSSPPHLFADTCP